MQSLKLLSVLAAIRLDDDDIDDIEKTLEAELLDSSSSAIIDRSSKKFDPLSLASVRWEQVHFYCCLILFDEVSNVLILVDE